jgi:serralysin
MKKLLFNALFCTIFLSFSYDISADDALTNQKILEISQRLEGYTTDQLVERRSFLIKSLEDIEEGEDSETPATTRSNMLLELSIIEQLLILAGIVLADNVSEDTPTPPDTVFPVLTVLGDNPATVELGATYTDAGATSDGGETVTSSGTVDTNTVGSYIITYSATDSAGNVGTATRTVNVVDTTAPVITVTGDDPATVELGGTYTDAGATATDLDTVTVTSSSDVDTDTVGSYTVTYTATDASGNAATASRTVNVVDTTAPVITSTSFTAAENQTDVGTVTATDASGSITFAVPATETELAITSSGVLTFTSAPDFETKSTITSFVIATDPSGNSSTELVSVTVTDVNEAPTITKTSFTAPENQTAIGTVTATDPENDTLTFSVPATETELAITSSGVLTFTSAPDFETKSTITAYVTVTDTAGNTDTELVSVSVTDVDEDDDEGTGTGTGTGTSTGTGTGTGTGT